MLTLKDGRNELWQWDTGRTLTVETDCSHVHFSNKVFGRSIDVDVVDGMAIIPDILLQTDKELTAWAFVGTAENGYTKISKVFKVNKRNKPADYVFTPTDQTTLDDILDRIEDLEKRPNGGNGGITKEVDPTVPDWAKQPQKPKYTAEEVGALPDTTKIPSTAEDVSALPANAFIPKTAADVGAIPAPETATVGQTIVVKEVDESGKPTSWECVDVAGDDGPFELIVDKTFTEDMATITIAEDDNGDPFALKEFIILCNLIGASTNSGVGYALIATHKAGSRLSATNGACKASGGKGFVKVVGSIRNGVLDRYFNASSTADQNSETVFASYINVVAGYDDGLKGITISSSNGGGYGNGTRVRIWGVRM